MTRPEAQSGAAPTTDTPEATRSAAPEPPEAGPAAAHFTVAAVARQLGIAPATLRTWDRRYGLGPSVHAAGSRRRYSSEDVALLMHMRQLVHGGVGAGEAAALALDARSHAGRSAPLAAQPAAVGSAPAELDHTGGAAVEHTSGVDLERARRAVLRSAWDLDGAAVESVLGEALAQHGVVTVWDRVLVPVLTEVGDRWARTGQGVEVEHLLSHCVVSVMTAPPAAEPSTGGRPLLLAGAEGEWHCLPLYALSAALAASGHVALMLGPATPADALASAVDRIGPAGVFLWSAGPHSAIVPTLAALRTGPSVAIVVGGPGWQPGSLPERATHVASLGEALDCLIAAQQGPRALT